MKQLTLVCLALLVTGCAGARCDKVRPYQQTAARTLIKVPGDLSEPQTRSRAPQVDADAPVRRADGRCLEEPPAYEPAEKAEPAA